MAGKKVGSIYINFLREPPLQADVGSATTSIRSFGKAGVSEARATTAALRLLKRFLNNSRAADQFLEKILHLGPAMQVASRSSGRRFCGCPHRDREEGGGVFREDAYCSRADEQRVPRR